MTARNLYLAGLAATAVLIAFAADGWWWVLILCVAIGLAPWFACSRLLDRIGELEGEVERLKREATPAPATVLVPLVAFDSLSKPERLHIAQDRPELYVVNPPGGDLPVADDDWPEEWTSLTPLHDDLAVERFMQRINEWGQDADR